METSKQEKNKTTSGTNGHIMEKKRKFRQEYYITNEEAMIWYLCIIETDENDIPLNSFYIRIPVTDQRFKIYPHIIN